MNNKILLTIISIAVILIIILFVIFNQQDSEPDETSISAKQFAEQIETAINETNIILNYLDYVQGDKVTIKDTIYLIKYRDEMDYTSIEFYVNTTLSSGERVSSIEFDIQGNITDIYQENDEVSITFTIKNVKFNYNNQYYDLEVYEEAYDEDYYISNSFTQILPQSTLKKI
jgi:hypothetical protein